MDLPAAEAETLSKQITDWRKGTILSVDEDARGKKNVFDSWQSRWAGRRSKVKYIAND